MQRPYIAMWLGILVCATAANLIQAGRMDPVHLAAARVAIAAAALLPLWWRERRGCEGSTLRTELRAALWPGVLLGVHFMTFLAGVRMTSVANATLLVNLAPAIVPFFAHAILRERIRHGEIAGTALGLIGVAVLVAGDFHMDRRTFFGDLTCLGSMVFFAAYLVLGRARRQGAGLWSYVVPLYAIATLTCLPVAMLRSSPPDLDLRREMLIALALGLGPTVIGHSALLYAVRFLRSQTVTLANLTQFIFAGLLAWALTGELPRPRFYPAAVLLVAGAVVAIRSAAVATTPIPARSLRNTPNHGSSS
ncbi:MAG: DMT family transporter [Kiritimatiellae bacterium]|nr:DMT family transporter [Kiritimatiellia bacterium]